MESGDVNNNPENDQAIKSLKKELHAANELIGILQVALGNESPVDLDKVSDTTKELIKTGKLTFSCLYSCMEDMESELMMLTKKNATLSQKLVG